MQLRGHNRCHAHPCTKYREVAKRSVKSPGYDYLAVVWMEIRDYAEGKYKIVAQNGSVHLIVKSGGQLL